MNVWGLAEQHLETLDIYGFQINEKNVQEKLGEIYRFMKKITNEYYIDGKIHPAYTELLKSVYYLENTYGKKSILNAPVKFKFNEIKYTFLETLVQYTRKYLYERRVGEGRTDVDINSLDFMNDCLISANFVTAFCKEQGIECYPIAIYPGFSYEAKLYFGRGHHFCNIVKYNNKWYLVDVTYSQFFKQGKNNLERVGVFGFCKTDNGTWVLDDKNHEKMAVELLTHGYVELNEDIFKMYMDSFALSFRNGLYYENTNDFSFTAPYTVEDYIRFLNGEDNQVNHEGKENLGFQERPIKNWEMKLVKK